MTKAASVVLLLSLAPAAWAAPKAKVTPLAPAVPALLPEHLPGDTLKATIHRLSNGLTVYLSPNKQVPRVSAHIMVRAGGKNDPAHSTGLAHYLEHMLFKGTQRFGTTDYAKEKAHQERIEALYELHYKATDPGERQRLYKEIDKANIEAAKYAVPNEMAKIYRMLGMEDLNAFTSEDATGYVIDIPANRLEQWAAMEAERFKTPVFRQFQTELETVYEEKNRSLDNAEWLVWDAVNAGLYKKHPYGTQTIIGSIEHLKNPSLKEVHAFYDRWYVPNNMAVALAGDFEPEAVLAVLEKHLGALKPKPLPPQRTWPLTPPKGVEKVEVRYEAEEKVVTVWQTVTESHEDAPALILLDMLMDNAAAGLINLELNQAQRVKAAGSYPRFRVDSGEWTMWALPKRGQTLEEAEALLLETLDRLKGGNFTEEDMKAVITSFEVDEKAKLESNEARVSVMGGSFIKREPWTEVVGRLDRLRRVTKADVLRAAGKYLGPDRVVVYRRAGKPELPKIAKPAFTKLEIDQSRVSAFGKAILAMPAAPIEPRWLVEGKDYAVTETPAGRMYSARNPFNDLFSITWVFARGRAHERTLCSALGLLDLSGAGDKSADDFKKKLFSLGTTLGYGCGEQESSVTLSGLDENLWESLQLMRERFRKPHVAPETLKKMVDVAIGNHQDIKKNPGAIRNALGEWARRGKESRVLGELSDAELESLKLDSLTALIKDYPGHAHRVGYVGNRHPGELAKLLDEGLKPRPAPARKPLKTLRYDKAKVFFTHRDMVQAQVALFVPDEPYEPAKSIDYRMLGNYLGGGGSMSNPIFQQIREARALAYSAGGGYRTASYKGDDQELHGGLGCQADKTVEATNLLRELLLSPPWEPSMFQETKDGVEQSYRADPIQFRGVPGALMSWEDLGLPPGDPRPERFKRLASYSMADLQGFAGKFKGKPATIYVLGHRDQVKLDELKKLGDFEEKPLDSLFPY